MKKRSTDQAEDDLRPHYDFDFKNMKPNRFASQKKVYKRQFVILDEDVAKVFDSSESVNDVLRLAIRAMRTAVGKRSSSKRQSSKRRAS